VLVFSTKVYARSLGEFVFHWFARRGCVGEISNKETRQSRISTILPICISDALSTMLRHPRAPASIEQVTPHRVLTYAVAESFAKARTGLPIDGHGRQIMRETEPPNEQIEKHAFDSRGSRLPDRRRTQASWNSFNTRSSSSGEGVIRPYNGLPLSRRILQRSAPAARYPGPFRRLRCARGGESRE
jgi:hypothetical protein